MPASRPSPPRPDARGPRRPLRRAGPDSAGSPSSPPATAAGRATASRSTSPAAAGTAGTPPPPVRPAPAPGRPPDPLRNPNTRHRPQHARPAAALEFRLQAVGSRRPPEGGTPTGGRTMQPKRIEREFGVPFAGQILEPAQWTQTALKKLPAEGRINWSELFGRSASVIIDIGCGNGRFLIGSAFARRDHDHLGTDMLPVVIRYARKRANQRGLTNVRFAVGGGYELLDRWVEPHSVSEIHCYHPQPYYDPAQVQDRKSTRLNSSH